SAGMSAFELRLLEKVELFARPATWDRRISAIAALRAHRPASPALRLQHAHALFASRRATDALLLLDSIDLAPLGKAQRVDVVMLRADALHVLGRFTEERELVQRLLAPRSNVPPERWAFHLIHLRARAGLGESGLERVIDSLMRDPFDFYHTLVPRVGNEMMAHRLTVMGGIVKRALARPEDARGVGTRRSVGGEDSWVYWSAGRLAMGEQSAAADSLLNHPAYSMPASMRTAWVGLSATIAAHLGDSLRARRLERSLIDCLGADCADATAWRARIAAALFDRPRAESLLDSAYLLGFPFSI